MNHDEFIRLGFFVAVLGLMALWEVLDARRPLASSKGRRWFGNLGLVAVDALVVRLLFPVAAIGTALAAESFGWGLFHHLKLPYALAVTAAVIVLDLSIYFQHVLAHALPLLWRFHRVHHADIDCDVTTGIRFHPVEITLSLLFKMAVVGALGLPALGVLIFEVLLNATSMFNHANVHIPTGFDRVLRWLIVTPDMHRIHHSINPLERNRNFGFNLPWWDRLFGTYRDQPAEGHQKMTLGVEIFREHLWQSLPRLLAMPFVRRAPS